MTIVSDCDSDELLERTTRRGRGGGGGAEGPSGLFSVGGESRAMSPFGESGRADGGRERRTEDWKATVAAVASDGYSEGMCLAGNSTAPKVKI